MNYGLIPIVDLLEEIKKIQVYKNTDIYKKKITPYVIILLLIRKDKLPEKYMYSYSDIGKLTSLTTGQVNNIVRQNNLQRKDK